MSTHMGGGFQHTPWCEYPSILSCFTSLSITLLLLLRSRLHLLHCYLGLSVEKNNTCCRFGPAWLHPFGVLWMQPSFFHKKRPGGSTNSIVKAKFTDTPKQRTSAFKARPSQCRVCFGPAKILNHADGWGAFPWLKVSPNTPSIPAMHQPFSPFIKPLIFLRYTWPFLYAALLLELCPAFSTTIAHKQPKKAMQKRTSLQTEAENKTEMQTSLKNDCTDVIWVMWVIYSPFCTRGEVFLQFL